MLKKAALSAAILIFTVSIWYVFFYKQANIIQIIGPIQKEIKNKTRNAPIVRKKETLASMIAAAKLLPPMGYPKEIKALYVTAPTALTPNLMENIISVVKASQVNALVINVKDNNSTYITGNMASLIRRLRREGVYPIARIVIFQDNHLAKTKPEFALKTADGELWGKRGFFWVDPSIKEIWDYNADIANKALDIGFLEINLDYIRFPDGETAANIIHYPSYKYDKPKKTVINEFSKYIVSKIKEKHPSALVSADIFAYSFLRAHDLGVGQKLTDLVDYYDVIAPMIYPSHYGAGNFGFDNPATEPYQVVLQTLNHGKRQLEKAGKTAIIRPWIQDFNMGAVYDQQKIQGQIQAVKDAFAPPASTSQQAEPDLENTSSSTSPATATSSSNEILATTTTSSSTATTVSSPSSTTVSANWRTRVDSPTNRRESNFEATQDSGSEAGMTGDGSRKIPVSTGMTASKSISNPKSIPPIQFSGWMSWNPSNVYQIKKYLKIN